MKIQESDSLTRIAFFFCCHDKIYSSLYCNSILYPIFETPLVKFTSMKDLFNEIDDQNVKLQQSQSQTDAIRILPKIENKIQDKNIQWFNQRLEQIQKLKLEKEELIKIVENLKRSVDSTAHEAIQELISVSKNILDKALNRLDAKSLSKNEKSELHKYITSTCEELERNYNADMSEYRKKAHEKLPEDEKREVNAMIAEFYNIGQAFDAGDLYNLSKEEMQEKYGEDIFEKIVNRHENFDPLEALFGSFNIQDEPRKERQKTKKELEREQAKEELEQLTNKDFSQLYKSLSKRVHPDLEQDTEKKIIREELMKRLIAAKETRDLFELLCIEFELNIADGENNAATSTDALDAARIKRFNDILLEQRKKLEADVSYIKNFDPDTSFYFRNFYHKNPKQRNKKINEYTESIRTETIELSELSKDIDTIRGTKDFIHYQMILNDEPFMNFMFGDDDDF